MTSETFKTYARAIDARAFIEARPELNAIPHQIEMVDNRAMPVFTITSEAQRAIIVAAQDQMPEKKRAAFKVFDDTGAASARSATTATVNETTTTKEPILTTTTKEPAPQPKSMSEKAMLADLTIKGWSGRATDNEAAAFTAMHYQANEAWTKFTKRLVRGDALKAIKKAETAARATHKELTLPWNENGQRILPAPAFQDYMQRMGDHRDEHERAVAAFVASYDSLIEEAQRELGGLFNADDYPDAADLQAKFVFDTELSALDVKGDFRVQMSDAEMQALQAQITQRTEARLASAMTDVYQRLHGVVAHMADRLKAYKPKATADDRVENPFRDATLNNVRDIVDLMPKLNITNDPALDALATEVRQNLLEADAATLRSDDAKRAAVAQRAEEIADAMAGMM